MPYNNRLRYVIINMTSYALKNNPEEKMYTPTDNCKQDKQDRRVRYFICSPSPKGEENLTYVRLFNCSEHNCLEFRYKAVTDLKPFRKLEIIIFKRS